MTWAAVALYCSDCFGVADADDGDVGDEESRLDGDAVAEDGGVGAVDGASASVGVEIVQNEVVVAVADVAADHEVVLGEDDDVAGAGACEYLAGSAT